MQAEDIARGLLLHMQDQSSLQKWASDVLTGSDDLDLETHPDGDLLLNVLWDASFEGHINEQQVAVARRVAGT